MIDNVYVTERSAAAWRADREAAAESRRIAREARVNRPGTSSAGPVAGTWTAPRRVPVRVRIPRRWFGAVVAAIR